MNATTGAGHVAFFSNQIRTRFYAQIARRLSERGVRISWIATSPRWVEVARKEAGLSDADILDLSQDLAWMAAPALSPDELALLSRVEAAGGVAVKDAIIMDRGLNKQRWEIGLAYAASLARRLDAFLQGRGVDLCLGETTWCGEILAAQLVRLHGGVYAQPATIRIPSERFGLLEDVATDRLFCWCDAASEHEEQARHLAAKYDTTTVAPYYMASVPSPIQWRAHWTGELLAALSGAGNRGDYTIPPLRARAAGRLRMAWNARSAGVVVFERGPSAPDTPYVFVTLHVQPEASIDVWGAPFNNQIENLRALSRILPVEYELLVKEHRSAIGNRGRAVYAELARIPGLRLIDPGADTQALMRGAKLVASPSSTACYEAAVMGVPAVCFGRIFFGRALLREAFDPYGVGRAEMAGFLSEAQRLRASGELRRRAESFIALAIANSFEGRYGDPTDPEAMRPDNLEKCAAGVMEGLAHMRARAAKLTN